MLDHIHIENFRLFKNLDIPKVGQVNLITGKNNSGKTTLLEALRLWVNRRSLTKVRSVLMHILKQRGELNRMPEEDFATIFYERYRKAEINDLEMMYKGEIVSILSLNEKIPSYDIEYTTSPGQLIDSANFVPASFELINTHLWKNIDLTEKEEQVAEILRIIEPNIVRISVNEADGTAKVRLKNSPKPLPLKNFGEGMNRLLTVALGLVSAENDMLLIDEIDLGLHHSVQGLLWEIVFQKSKDLNVQVFATTHSSDCVQAFSDIANKPEYAGMGNYIRLQRKKDGDIVAVDYEMEELESAMDLNLETR
jgi:AAA15 family ATPase/GTPase